VIRRPWKNIVGFALLGLAVAAGAYAYAAFFDYSKPTTGLDVALTIVSVVLCPPQLIFGFCIDCEVIGWSGFMMYSIVGILNATLYALIGFIVSTLQKGQARRPPKRSRGTHWESLDAKNKKPIRLNLGELYAVFARSGRNESANDGHYCARFRGFL
jgi:hypothetical protein